MANIVVLCPPVWVLPERGLRSGTGLKVVLSRRLLYQTYVFAWNCLLLVCLYAWNYIFGSVYMHTFALFYFAFTLWTLSEAESMAPWPKPNLNNLAICQVHKDNVDRSNRTKTAKQFVSCKESKSFFFFLGRWNIQLFYEIAINPSSNLG